MIKNNIRLSYMSHGVVLDERLNDIKKIFGGVQDKPLNREEVNLDDFLKNIGATDIVFVKCGSYGHTYKITTGNKYYALKMVYFPKKDNKDYLEDKDRAENVELRILHKLHKLLLNKASNHIMINIKNYVMDINSFKNPKLLGSQVGKKYLKLYQEFLDKINNKKLHDKVSVSITEWAEYGDLSMFFTKFIDDLTVDDLRIIFFQIIFTLGAIQIKYPNFRHNDLKANNILVSKNNYKDGEGIIYKLDDLEFEIPTKFFNTHIWDFDFSCIGDKIKNKKLDSDVLKKKNITNKQNKYYDLHYLFLTIFSSNLFKNVIKKEPSIKEFYNDIVPTKYQLSNSNIKNKYITSNGRLFVDDEFITPYKILKENKFFEKLRLN